MKSDRCSTSTSTQLNFCSLILDFIMEIFLNRPPEIYRDIEILIEHE